MNKIDAAERQSDQIDDIALGAVGQGIVTTFSTLRNLSEK